MRLAMRGVALRRRIMGAPRLVPITFAHIDACFYAGQAHVDFAQLPGRPRRRLAVPAWTNNGVVSLADRGAASAKPAMPASWRGARRLDASSTRSSAASRSGPARPISFPGGPKFGDHIAAGESNAVTFYNSVDRRAHQQVWRLSRCRLRADRQGAVRRAAYRCGAARHASHRHRGNRRPIAAARTFSIICSAIMSAVLPAGAVPVIDSLDALATEDDLKALSAAAAASGGVELWHGVGVTPEARTRDEALRRVARPRRTRLRPTI